MNHRILFLFLFFICSCSTTENINKSNTLNIEKESNSNKKSISWNSGTYIETKEVKQCISIVTDEYKNYLSVNFSKRKKDNKKKITIQLKSNVEIKNNGNIIVDIIYYSKNKKANEQRIRMSKYKDNNNVFYLNSINTTESSLNNITRDISKYQNVKFKIYDKNWVSYEYNFSLKNSKENIHENAKKCL